MTDTPRPLIAHVIFRLDVGGLENGLVNLINAMPADEFRHAIVCIDRATDFRQRITVPDVEIVQIQKRPGRDPAALWRLFRAFRRLSPAVLHTRNLGALDALLPALLAGVGHRIHGEHGWDVTDVGGTGSRQRLLRRLHAPMVTEYVALSEEIGRYLVNKVGVDRDRISVICNGVNTSRFQPRDSSRRTAPLPHNVFDTDARVFGAVGRMDPVKGYLDLAEAFVRFAASGCPGSDRARLVIVGDGATRSAVQECLSGAGLAERCWLPGKRDDIPALLPLFDVFVQPSLAEGISNTVLEAMACGLPVIGTEVGGNPELIVAGETGSLVPASRPEAMAAALERYSSSPEAVSEQGAAARRRAVQVLGFDAMLERYTELYRRAISRKAGR